MTRNFYKLFFLIVSILCFSSAFNQTANITAGCAPVNITFTAPSSTSTYFWDFKDGASSTQQNPTNTFTKAGTYKVEFKTSASGAVVGTVEINVYDKPVPTLSSTSALQGCTPLQINLQANITLPAGVTVSNYNWAMGEGTGQSGKNINNFTYANPGIYDLSLSIVTNYET